MDIREWPYKVDDKDVVLHLIIDGDPVSKARPRFGAGGKVYTPAKTAIYEEFVGYKMKEALMGDPPDSESTFALRCFFYRGSRQRIDCDNLIKAQSDAANGVVWEDDAQVGEIIGKLFLNQDIPRAEVLIYRIQSESPK